MPRFNKDQYITDDSYEIPWKSLRSMGNQEARVRGYLERLEAMGVVEWDDHATITDVQRSEDWYYHDAVEGILQSARQILVEGIGPDGEEIVFLKKISPRSSSSTFYIDGQSFSASTLAGKNPNIYSSKFPGSPMTVQDKDWD